MSLSTYPAAPALSASRRYSGFACIVTRITLVAVSSNLMARHVARPSCSGIRTSIRARSGCKWRQSANASRPFAASPTSFNPRWLVSMARRPALASSWSSAITNRAGLAFRQSNGSLLMEHFPLIRCQQRYLGHHQGTGIWLAGNHKVSTDKLDSLQHFAQPNMLTKDSLLEHRKWLETIAPVLHLKANRRVVALKHKACSGRACVLACVGERLLRNPEERGFNRWRQAL